MTDEALVNRYADVLADLPESYLDRSACEGLSPPFLVSGPASPTASEVMVLFSQVTVPQHGGNASS